MIRNIEAIYSNGAFQPIESLQSPDRQRVRLTIEPLDSATDEQRQEALEAVIDGLKRSKFRLVGPRPTRDDLHERV